jgi:hypothetical protein
LLPWGIEKSVPTFLRDGSPSGFSVPMCPKSFSLEQAFQAGFNQVTAIGRKVDLSMGDLDRGAHETKRMATCSMDKFFRDIGTEKPDGHAVLGKLRSNFFISQRGDGFELF